MNIDIRKFQERQKLIDRMCKKEREREREKERERKKEGERGLRYIYIQRES